MTYTAHTRKLAAIRMARSRARRKAAGLVRVELFVPRAHVDTLRDFAHKLALARKDTTRGTQ